MAAFADFDTVTVADVEAPVVGVAHHHIGGNKLAFGERIIGMGTGIFNGVILVTRAEQGDSEAVEVEGFGFAGLKVRGFAAVDASILHFSPFGFGDVFYAKAAIALENALLGILFTLFFNFFIF